MFPAVSLVAASPWGTRSSRDQHRPGVPKSVTQRLPWGKNKAIDFRGKKKMQTPFQKLSKTKRGANRLVVRGEKRDTWLLGNRRVRGHAEVPR